MSERRFALIAGLGCLTLVILLIVAASMGLYVLGRVSQTAAVRDDLPPVIEVVPEPIPTLAPSTPRVESQKEPEAQSSQQLPGAEPGSLTALYERVNPGVVSIQVFVRRGLQGGEGAGSGFVFDKQGHIITNNHVVANVSRVVVVFYDGFEAEAEIIGTDADSDLAVVRVDELGPDVHPLPVGDSDQVVPGEWVIAIGNPFGQQSSMTAGIVSAVGRLIPSGVTPFSIPQAIQTDAAINPGNSGGPLLNLKGEVIGVNAQIAQSGVRANSGVGFAIPSNIVRMVVPELIETGSYQWSWLGVEGGSVNLAIMEANGLETQQGAYISRVVSGSPADDAGLQGSRQQNRLVGGDVVIEADGKPIADFSELLVEVAFRKPGDRMELTVLRNGRRRQVTVILAPRPANFGP